MNPSLSDFKTEFLDLVLEFLWKRWSAIGVSGHASNPDGRVIDPEALLIFTTVFARYEPRLFDEVLDWLRLNGEAINLQRLNNLEEKYEFGDLRVLAAMADRLGDKAVLRKWRRVAGLLREDGANDPVPLFLSRDGSSLPAFGAQDERFAKFGLTRGKLEFRGLSQCPNPSKPENFLFRLRAFFGLNARCETVLYLLTHSVGHPRRIAQQVGYSPRTIENTLNEMEGSGLVFGRQQAREKLFWLKPDEWSFLTKGITPVWPDWAMLLSSLHRIWKTADHPGMAQGSALWQASEMRKVLEKITRETAPVGHPLGFGLPSGLIGEAYLEAVLQETLSVLRQA